MKNIVILSNDIGGLYKFRKELLQALINIRYCIIIVSSAGDCMSAGYIDELKEIGCNIELVNIERHGMNPLKELKVILAYEKIMKKYKPIMVFTYTIKPNVYGGLVCSKYNIPYVANITGLGTAVENPGIKQKVTLFLYKKGLKKAQKVFLQNTANRDFMVEKKIVSGPYDLLPGSGVNLSEYRLLEYPPEGEINFLFISRIMKEKGIDQYLDAAEFIHTKYANTNFHICGAIESEYNTERLNHLIENGVVKYHGVVKDTIPLQRMSNCTIHPTYYPEGLSNVLLESCACGRPIITTDRAGCREVVENGINGYVVKEKNSQDLIAKIEKFLKLSNEKQKAMGLAGRSKVEKEFNRQIVVEKYLAEIKEI